MSSTDPRSEQRPRRRYSFGEFTLDLDRGVLTRGGEEVPLRPKSFEALTYLIEHHGQLVAKSTLIEAVWPDTAVGDNSLAQCLFDIRRALGDDSQQIIRTVARRGYIFTPVVTTPVIAFPDQPGPLPVQQGTHPRRRTAIAAVAALAIGIITVLLLRRSARQELTYQQITNFTDSVVRRRCLPTAGWLPLSEVTTGFKAPIRFM